MIINSEQVRVWKKTVVEYLKIFPAYIIFQNDAELEELKRTTHERLQ
jgi:hypothetical protein